MQGVSVIGLQNGGCLPPYPRPRLKHAEITRDKNAHCGDLPPFGAALVP